MDKICEILIIYIQFGGSEVSQTLTHGYMLCGFILILFSLFFWYAVLIFP